LLKKVAKSFQNVKFEVVKFENNPLGIDGKALEIPYKIFAKNIDGTRVAVSDMFKWFDDAIKHSGFNREKGTFEELVKKLANDVTRPFGDMSSQKRREAFDKGLTIVREKVHGNWMEYAETLKENMAKMRESVAKYIFEHHGQEINGSKVNYSHTFPEI
jgi:hypothetical protein